MSSLRTTSLVIAAGTAALFSGSATAQETMTVADVGRDYFQRYCSSCHGSEGKGDGPFANLLKTPPPDLTTLAQRNGGSFPDLKVAETIDGRRPLGAHGTRDMPIWGERFGETVAGGPAAQSAIRGQVALFVAYLRSIQQE